MLDLHTVSVTAKCYTWWSSKAISGVQSRTSILRNSVRKKKHHQKAASFSFWKQSVANSRLKQADDEAWAKWVPYVLRKEAPPASIANMQEAGVLGASESWLKKDPPSFSKNAVYDGAMEGIDSAPTQIHYK